MTTNEKYDRVLRLSRDAMYHAILGLSEINQQQQRMWSGFDTTDCEYHLNAALGYLVQLREVLSKDDRRGDEVLLDEGPPEPPGDDCDDYSRRV